MRTIPETPLLEREAPRAGALVVFARPPRPGQVKTRLAAEIGPVAAAELYRCFLADLLSRLRCAQGPHAADTDVWLAWARGPGDQWDALPPELAGLAGGLPVVAQEGDSLGERLAHVTGSMLARGYRAVTIIGSDSPAAPVPEMLAAGRPTAPDELVLGPAADGGFWLIGLAQPARWLRDDLPWSTDRALQAVCDTAERAGLRVRLIAAGYDVDVRADLARLAADLARTPGLCPLTREALARRGWAEPAPPA